MKASTDEVMARLRICFAPAMHVGSLKRFCHPYYAVHILVILSYAAVRMLFLGEPLMMFVPDGLMGLTRVRAARCGAFSARTAP